MRSVNVIRLLSFFAVGFVITSCQKELSFGNGNNGGGSGGGGNSTANIAGDYDFVGLVAHTEATVTASQLGQTVKTVTVSDYVTFNNSGTLRITSNQMTSTDIAFDIDTMMNAKTYINNVLMDDSDFPFIMSSPPQSGTSTYVRNSPDSITITGPFAYPDPTGNPATGSIGSKLEWHGDTLHMKTATTYTRNITQGGIPAVFTGTVTGVQKFRKK
jgi:hypothetical protein